jgi:hypothetical protein
LWLPSPIKYLSRFDMTGSKISGSNGILKLYLLYNLLMFRERLGCKGHK